MQKWFIKSKSSSAEKTKVQGKSPSRENHQTKQDQISVLADENFDLVAFQTQKLGQASEKGILNYLDELRSLREFCKTKIQDVVLNHNEVITEVLDLAPEIEKQIQQLQQQLEQFGKFASDNESSFKSVDQLLKGPKDFSKTSDIQEEVEVQEGVQSEWFSSVTLKLLEVDVAIMKGHSEGTVQKFIQLQQLVNKNVYFEEQQEGQPQKVLTSWQEVDQVQNAMAQQRDLILTCFERAFEEKENRGYVLSQVVTLSDELTGVLFILQCGELVFQKQASKAVWKGQGQSSLEFLSSVEKMFETTSKVCEIFVDIIKDIFDIFRAQHLKGSMVHLLAWAPKFLDQCLSFLQDNIVGFDRQLDRCSTCWGLLLVYVFYLEDSCGFVLYPHAQKYIDSIMIPMIEFEFGQMSSKCINLVEQDVHDCFQGSLKDEIECLNLFVSEVGRIGRQTIPIHDSVITNKIRQTVGDIYKGMVQMAYQVYEVSEQTNQSQQNMQELVNKFKLAVDVGLPYEFREVAESPLNQLVNAKRMMTSLEALKGNIALQKR
eukprot:TRINITY_DN32433_c0_g1_i5.p1 TRINITY_DN32433_c0_g1~~TRINITY_DN32433_c0_g1_i5.p1  ORF type:complete len:544 (+),score=64.00 TRINITY_DN32433_c0_g1_i5:369-2000(+)